MANEVDYDAPIFEAPDGSLFIKGPDAGDDNFDLKPTGLTLREIQKRAQQRITDEPSISKTAAQMLLGVRQGYDVAMPKTVGGGLEAIGGVLPESLGGKALRRIGREGREGANIIGREYEDLGKGVGGGVVGESARGIGSSVVPSVATLLAAAPSAILAGGGAAAAGVSAAALAARQALQAKVVGTAAAIAAGVQSLSGTYGDAFEAYKKQGFSDEEAYKKAYVPAVASGLVTGLITKGFGGTGLEKALITKSVPKGFGKAAFEVGKDVGLEAIEEGTDEEWQAVIRNLTFNPEATAEENLKGILQAGIAGGVMAGAVRGAQSAPSAISDLVSRKPIATPTPLPAQPAQLAPAAPTPVAAPQAATPQAVPVAPAATLPTPAPVAPVVQPIAAQPIQQAPQQPQLTPPTAAQRSELEDIRGDLEAAQLAGDTERVQYLSDVLRLKEREAWTKKVTVKRVEAAAPATPASETPAQATPKPRRVAITPEAQAAAPRRQQALPESPSLPEPLEGQPYDTRLETRPEASMPALPVAELGIERGRVSPVDPDLAAAVEDVRGGYAERTARELEAGANPILAMSPEQLEKEIVAEIGPEGGKLWQDWREINRAIESGKSRTEAIRDYLLEASKAKAQAGVEMDQRTVEFSKSNQARIAQMPPDEYREKVAKPQYDAAVAKYRPRKKGEKPRSYPDWMRIVGTGQHESAIRDALLNDAPVSSAAVDTYGIKLPPGYIREGDLYVYRPAAQAQPEQARGSLPKEGIGSIYQMDRRGETKWMVQQGEKRGFGDSIHDTEQEAVAESQREATRREQRAESLRKLEAEKNSEAKAKAEREDLGAFTDGMSPMKRGSVVKQLTARFQYLGKEMSRRDIIRELVNQGRKVEVEAGQRVLSNDKGEYLGEKVLTKAGLDYAEHLIRERDAQMSLGQTPTARPAPSLSKMQVEQAVRELFDGNTPPNFQVTHNYGKVFNGREVRGWYDPSTGAIWLNAAYLRSPQEARAVFVEEAFHAIQNDPSVKAELGRLVASLTPEQLAEARSAYGNISEEQLQMEAVADILEKQQLTQEQRGILARLWDAVLGAIERLYGKFTGKVFTERDAQDVLAKAIKAAAEGGRSLRGGGEVYAQGGLAAKNRRSSLRLRLTREALTELALSQASWRDWYSEHQETLDDFFGDHADVFQKILSATSQAATVKANVGLALKAFGQWIRGEQFSGYLPAVIGNLNRIRDEEQLRGQKISAYQSANKGESVVVVDRHIARMLFGVDSPSKAQFEKAQKVLTEIANEMDWKPEQVQAALWAASIVKSGKTPESYANYLKRLETESAIQSRTGIAPSAGSGGDGAGGGRGRYSGGSQAASSTGVAGGQAMFSAGSPQNQLDQQYFEAIQRGDMQEVQALVDEAARGAGSTANSRAKFSNLLRGRTPAVDSGVSSRIYDSEVLKPVIEAIPVEVVNMLGSKQGATNALLNNPSVFKDALSASKAENLVGESSLARLRDEAMSVAAGARAELALIPPADLDRKMFTAVDALQHNLIAAVGYKSTVSSSGGENTLRGVENLRSPSDGKTLRVAESTLPTGNLAGEFKKLDSADFTGAFNLHKRNNPRDTGLLQELNYDPITYDDQGQIIPLSRRFQQESPDIRYSLGGPVQGVANENTRTIRGDDSKGASQSNPQGGQGLEPLRENQDLQAGDAGLSLQDRARVAKDLESSGAVLWGTEPEVEAAYTSSNRGADRSGNTSQSAYRGDSSTERGPVYSGTKATGEGVSGKPRVLITRAAESPLLHGQSNSDILAHRFLFGAAKASNHGQFNLGLFQKLPKLRIVFEPAGAAPLAAYYRGYDTIIINQAKLDDFDLSNPATAALLDAVISEELIHAAVNRLATNEEILSAWTGLSDMERKTAKDIYGITNPVDGFTDIQFANEYLRLVLQQRLSGKTTEQVVPISSQLKKILARLVNFLKRSFGNKPENSVARQLVERIEGAIRGDAPIKQPLFPGSGEMLATNISQSDATEVQGRAIEPSLIAAASRSVADLGRQTVEKFEQAGRQLEGLAYESKQFRQARSELNNLVSLHEGRLRQYPQDRVTDDMRANIRDGVSIKNGQIVVGDELVTKLAQMGVQARPELVKAMQAEVYFEQQARRLVDNLGKLATLKELRDYYRRINAPADEIQKLSDLISAKEDLVATLTPVTTNRGRGQQSIGERAGEITRANASKVELQSKRDALNLEPVQEFFGKGITELRDLSEKAKAAADLTRALMDNTTSISEVARLGEIYDKWAGFDATVKKAIQKGTLTEEQRVAVLTDLQKSFDEFDAAKFRMDDLYNSEENGLLKDIREAEAAIADAKVTSGMADVLVADALKAAKGEMGLTGTAGDAANIANLEASTGAITTLAMNLGRTIDQNRWLYNFLMAPGSMPAFGASVAQSLGISETALREILKVVQQSPSLASAIVTLTDDAAAKLANSPPLQMQAIAPLAISGNALAMTLAANLTSQIVQQANAQGTKANAARQTAARQLAQSVLRLRTLQQGKALFNQTANSPAFQQLRGTVSLGAAGAQKMVVLGPTGPVLRGFSTPSKEYQKELKINVESDAPELERTREKVWKYVQNAEQYVADYERAEMEHQMDPSKPTPQQLGFDRADYNGLKHALKVQIWPMFLDLGDLDTEAQYLAPALMRKLMKWPGTGAIFGQYEQIGKLVGGMAGSIFRQQVARYKRGYLDTKRVSSQFQNLPKLQSEAMRSHGIKAEETYRAVFNEMAGYGRLYGSPLRVGFKLPISQQVVTKEDMAFFNRTLDFFEKLRREATEIDPVTGVRYMRGWKEITRKGAYTGDKSMARHLNRDASQFIADVIDAYKDNPQGFTPTTDLSASSNDKAVAYWNNHLNTLKRHILDSPRTDRSFKQSAEMAAAEKRIAARWLAGSMDQINSVQDLVDLIAAEIQPSAGSNPADVARQGLNNELLQYVAHANRIQKERAEDNAKNSGASIALSSDNEFTKPAANLELPSEYYNYGAVSSVDRITALSRANHTVLVDFANSLRSAIKELEGRLRRMEKATGKELELLGKDYGGNRQEMKDMLQLLKDSLKKFEDTYRAGGPDIMPTRLARKMWDTVVGNVLAKIPTGLRNISQGQFQVFAVAAQMHYMSRRLAMWKALTNIPRGYLNTGYLVARNISGFIDRRLGLDQQAQRTIQKLVDVIADDFVFKPAQLALGKPLIGAKNVRDSFTRVRDWLGFDTSQDWIEASAQSWRDAGQFQTAKDQQEAEKNAVARAIHFADRLANTGTDTVNAFVRGSVLESGDTSMNALSLGLAANLEQRLQEVAMVFGERLAKDGITRIDPTDKRSMLLPQEWWPSSNEQDGRNSLGEIRRFLESSASAEGFQLEKNLLQYYQDKLAGKPAKIFDQRTYEAVQRSMIAENNAAMPTNRASSGQAYPIWRSLLALTGYPADATLKMLRIMVGGSRDRSAVLQAFHKLPLYVGIAAMAVLTQGASEAAAELYRRKIQGQRSGRVTPLDPEFWTDPQHMKAAMRRYFTASSYLIGDLISGITGWAEGRKTIDPAQRAFLVSTASAVIRELASGAKIFRDTGDLSKALIPIRNLSLRMSFGGEELSRLLGINISSVNDSKKAIAENAKVKGFEVPPPGSFGTAGYTSVQRRTIGEDVSRMEQAQRDGDTEGYAKAKASAQKNLAELEQFYLKKRLEAGDSPEVAARTAKSSIWADYQEINPVTAALGGKRPTAEQYKQLVESSTGERGAVIRQGIKAWQDGAQALFGKPGNITKEDVAENRPGGTVREPSYGRVSLTGGVSGRMVSVGSRSPRGRRAKIRRVSLTGRRRRISPMKGRRKKLRRVRLTA